MVSGHGTAARYNRGCRCQPCRDAWADYIRAWRRRHGRRSRVEHITARDLARLDAAVSEALRHGADIRVPVTLSPLGGQVLVSIERRLKRRRGEIVDQLLRRHGVELLESGG